MKTQNVQVCTQCVMDTIANPAIEFNADGVSNFWEEGLLAKEQFVLSEEESFRRNKKLVETIKAAGAGQEHDCIVGLSGGVDSSFVAVWAKENGLRPLAVHFDNGWNSDTAVTNIKNICEILDIDLITYVVNWEEYVDLQRAMIKASVVDIETITDNSHKAVTLDIAKKHKIKYIVSGANAATESMMPKEWNWNKQDATNFLDIHKKYGERPIKSYRYITQRQWVMVKYGNFGPRYVRPLENLNFKKFKAMEELKAKVKWQYYGGKHYESRWTKFYQAHILPQKFHIDKRKVHLSSLILNDEITRADALEELKKPLYTPEELARDKEYVLKKLRFTEHEWNEIMHTPRREHSDYKTDQKIINFLHRSYLKAKGLTPS